MNKDIRGVIFDIQRFSIHDGPGIRTIVFLKGCPLRCLWCSNPESQATQLELLYNSSICIGCKKCLNICPQKAITFLNHDNVLVDRSKCDVCGICVSECPTGALRLAGEVRSVSSIIEEVKRDRVFFESSGGGVTFSGGEPFAQPSFLYELLKLCKLEGFHTTIETSGKARWTVMEHSLPYIDLILFDLKHPNSQIHADITGISNTEILSNLNKLLQTKASVLVRIPIIPGINTNLETRKDFLNLFREFGIKTIEILPYHIYGVQKYEMLGRPYPGNEIELDESKETAIEFYQYMIQNGVTAKISH